jgi:hypothetical protein
MVQSQPVQIVHKTLSQNIPPQNKDDVVAQVLPSKCEALVQAPASQKKIVN